MRPGPFGAMIPPWVDRLRNPLRLPPPDLRSWCFQFSSPPYGAFRLPVTADEVAAAAMQADQGLLLVADADVFNSDYGPQGLAWIQDTIPFLSVVLRVDALRVTVLDELVRRLARRGITVVPRGSVDPPSIADLILRTTDPVSEAEGALRTMLPRMDAGARAQVAALIQAGLQSAADPEGPYAILAGNDRRFFFRVGRALGAALWLQRAERGTSNLALAHRAGYGSASSMEASLRRTLGRGAGQIRRHGRLEVAALACASPGGGEGLAPTRTPPPPWHGRWRKDVSDLPFFRGIEVGRNRPRVEY